MIAIVGTCVFVALMAGWAWYDSVIKPAVQRDLGMLEVPGPVEEAALVARFGERTGIRLPDPVWDGCERRTVHVRPSKWPRPRDAYDHAE